MAQECNNLQMHEPQVVWHVVLESIALLQSVQSLTLLCYKTMCDVPFRIYRGLAAILNIGASNWPDRTFQIGLWW